MCWGEWKTILQSVLSNLECFLVKINDWYFHGEYREIICVLPSVETIFIERDKNYKLSSGPAAAKGTNFIKSINIIYFITDKAYRQYFLNVTQCNYFSI